MTSDGPVATILTSELSHMKPIAVPFVLFAFVLGAMITLQGNHHRLNAAEHPVSESPLWLTYSGDKGPGGGKHIVLIAADQEYRSEHSMPMLARLLAKHHGFHCTVLFSLNQDNDIGPTQNLRWEDKTVTHNIPGMSRFSTGHFLGGTTFLISTMLSLVLSEIVGGLH